MKVLTRKRVIALSAVAAFVAAFAAVGAVSRSTPTPGVPLPYSPWYWTMAVSPSDTKVLVLGTSSGLFRSADAGKTWLATGPKGISATSIVGSGDSLFAGGLPVKPDAIPVVRRGSARAAPTGAAVLVSSSDGGKSWRDLHPDGLPDVSIQALAVDPANASNLYALLTTGRLYRSADGGGTFALVSPKLGIPPWAIAVTRGGHLLGGDMDNGSHLSSDGKAWQQVPFTDANGGAMVMEYAVQPSDSTRVLMTSIGIEISTDGGITWHVALKTKVMFGPVAFAPGTSGLAYALGFDRSVWRSEDGGRHWSKVS